MTTRWLPRYAPSDTPVERAENAELLAAARLHVVQSWVVDALGRVRAARLAGGPDLDVADVLLDLWRLLDCAHPVDNPCG